MSPKLEFGISVFSREQKFLMVLNDTDGNQTRLEFDSLEEAYSAAKNWVEEHL